MPVSVNPFVLDVTTTDTYQYLRCPGSTHLTLQISNAAISIGYRALGEDYPPNDEPFLPVVGGIDRPPFDEIRVKSYAINTPANVKIRASSG